MDIKKIIKETVAAPRSADERRFAAQHKVVKSGYVKPGAEDATDGNYLNHKRAADKKRGQDAADYDDAYADSGETNLDDED